MVGRRRRARSCTTPAAAVFFALWLATSHAETITGKVVDVASGDALTVLSGNGQQRVYLAGIDAPQRGQPYASRSWQNLMHMAYGKEATLECRKVDRDTRKVCKVRVQPLSCSTCGHTLDVALAQIVAGAAWWHRKYASEQSEEDQGRYESEELEACRRRRGLWALANPTPTGCRRPHSYLPDPVIHAVRRWRHVAEAAAESADCP